jgi:hypothetical protein
MVADEAADPPRPFAACRDVRLLGAVFTRKRFNQARFAGSGQIPAHSIPASPLCVEGTRRPCYATQASARVAAPRR